MNVAFISFVEPTARDNGKKIVLDGLLNFFIDQPDIQVTYFLLSSQKITPPHRPGVSWCVLPFKRSFKQVLSAFWRSLVCRKVPLQQAMLYDNGLKTKLCQSVLDSQPDVIIYDTIRVRQFFDAPRSTFPHARHIVFFDDLFAVRYQKMLQAMNRYPGINFTPLGSFAHNIPAWCQPVVTAKWVSRLLLRHEIKTLATVEVKASEDMDLGLLMSCQEMDVLCKQGVHAPLSPLPVYFPHTPTQAMTRCYNGKPVFVFLGDLRLAHNAFSLQHFIEHHLAQCLAQLPDMQLHIIGKHPSPALQASASRYASHVHFLGFVEDLHVPLSQCTAMLIPLLFGSGVKIKTLEAMRFGVPMISTGFGVEGIMHAEQSGVIIEDDLSAFAQHMRALTDGQVNAHASAQIQTFYDQYYHPDRVAARYRQYFLPAADKAESSVAQ